jgi:flagellar basal body L-ring protein FlgH
MYREQGFKKRTLDAKPIQDPRTMSETGFRKTNQNDILPTVQRNYKPLNYRHTQKDFIDNDNTGSLWASNGQTNYYFTKNKIRAPGDIITLKVEKGLFQDIGAEIKRLLSPSEKESELTALQTELDRRNQLREQNQLATDQVASSAASPTAPGLKPETQKTEETGRAPAMASLDQPKGDEVHALFSNVDISPVLGLKEGDAMKGEILQRNSNGNYRIRALKRVSYRRGAPRDVNIFGVVKASDINDETDTINSGSLYEYRIDISQ